VGFFFACCCKHVAGNYHHYFHFGQNLSLWHQKTTLVNVQGDAEKTECHLTSLAKNMQSNGQPFKSLVFCTVHWAVDSGVRGLRTELFLN
jgi:hypothetical protein